MNKMKKHTQEVWLEILGILTEPFFYTEKDWRNFKTHNHTPRTTASFTELAEELTRRGIFNYYGKPYTEFSVRLMIERMGGCGEVDDFRSQHYPKFLELKDIGVGRKMPTRNLLSKNRIAEFEEDEKEEKEEGFHELYIQHLKDKKLQRSVQNVNLSL